MTARWRHLFRCQGCGTENESYTKELYDSVGVICSGCSEEQGKPVRGDWELVEQEQVRLPPTGVPLHQVPNDVLEGMKG